MLPSSSAGVLEGERDPTLRPPKKKKASAPHLWRLSNSSPKSPLLLDRASCLQKSHSELNLALDRMCHHDFVDISLCLNPLVLHLVLII